MPLLSGPGNGPLERSGDWRCEPAVRPVGPAAWPDPPEQLASQRAGGRSPQPGGPGPGHVLGAVGTTALTEAEEDRPETGESGPGPHCPGLADVDPGPRRTGAAGVPGHPAAAIAGRVAGHGFCDHGLPGRQPARPGPAGGDVRKRGVYETGG